MTKQQVNECLEELYSTLEVRVGRRMARKMSPLQMSQFEKLIDAQDEKGALTWLKSNFPDYRSEVRDEYDLIYGKVNDAVSAQRQVQLDSVEGSNV